MRVSPDPRSSPATLKPGAGRRSGVLLWAGIVGLAALVLVTGAAQAGPQQAQVPATDKTLQMPDANQPAQPAEPPTGRAKKQDAAAQQRKKDLTDESATLLTLAMALKAEVDKTNKDTLSINVIRKADQIEKLARNVKEQIRKTVGSS